MCQMSTTRDSKKNPNFTRLKKRIEATNFERGNFISLEKGNESTSQPEQYTLTRSELKLHSV